VYSKTIGSVVTLVGTPSITDAGNGWFRLSFTVSVSASIASAFMGIAASDRITDTGSYSYTSASYAGDITKGIYLWGAQLEQRSAVSSYTPTTTQPITLYQPALQTAASGVARFDHNPVTQESLGLLIEEQRTNLVTYSEQFDNAAWIKTNGSLESNVVIAPDGTLTGDKFIPVTAASNGVNRSVGGVSSSAYTTSLYVKYAGFELCFLYDAQGNKIARFNLLTGLFVFVGAGITSTSAVIVGNGWYRISVTSTVTFVGFAVGVSDNDTSNAVTGDGYSGIYIWGAQLEAGAFPTSYIPTVASQVTRSADAASMTGTNFSSWYRQDEGTLYAEGKRIGVTTSSIATLTRASTDYYDSINIRYDGNSYGQVVNNNTVLASIASSAITTNVFAKSILAYKTDDIAYAVNAGSVGVDTSAILPTGIDTLRIGALASNTYNLNGTIKKIAYYPKRLDNAELVEMTEQ